MADDVEVIRMSREEWDTAVARALDEIGMSYEELADCAQRRAFPSPRARRLWVIIGDSPQGAE